MGCRKLTYGNEVDIPIFRDQEGETLEETTVFLSGRLEKNRLADKKWRDYYPYGTVAKEWINPPETFGIDDRYRFQYQGQFAEKDDETGWNHFELREYDVKIGRTLIVDPAREFWSPYLWVGNNPISGVDPTGGKCKGCPDGAEFDTYRNNDANFGYDADLGAYSLWEGLENYESQGSFDVASTLEINQENIAKLLFDASVVVEPFKNASSVYQKNVVGLMKNAVEVGNPKTIQAMKPVYNKSVAGKAIIKGAAKTVIVVTVGYDMTLGVMHLYEGDNEAAKNNFGSAGSSLLLVAMGPAGLVVYGLMYWADGQPRIVPLQRRTMFMESDNTRVMLKQFDRKQ